jgi:hypothetical protein
MSQPNVTVNQVNGNLGRRPASVDGIAGIILSGVAVGGQFALNDVLGPFYSLADAESKGITAAYDVTNTCCAHLHIKNFFAEAGNGRPLYVMVVAKTVTMAQMCDLSNLTTGVMKMLLAQEGRIKLVGITRTPQSGYTPTYADQFDEDIWAAITASKAIYASERAAGRPVDFFFEGRDFQGTPASAKDLRDTAGLNANRACLVIGQDLDVATVYSWNPKYAAVGLALGRSSRIPVHRNIGRVKDGALAGVIRGGFSNNSAYGAMSTTNVDVLNDKGYVYLRAHNGKAGYFFNDDHNAAPVSDDFSQKSRSRVMDKADRITHQVYVEEILNDLEIDPSSGKLAASTCKHYQGIINQAISTQMSGEISGVGSFCDPDQDVLSTDTIAVEISILPKGMARQIVANLAYTKNAIA